MRLYSKLHFFLLLASLSLTACSAGNTQVLEGTVTGIADGDTLYVLDAMRKSHKIRLLGIDAPERGQAFGEKSRQSLARLTYRKLVSVDWQGRDNYGRILGRVRVAAPECRQTSCPKTIDANLQQVRSGLAWWNRKFADGQFPGDARVYEKAERAARAARAGLWSERNPVPPWRWRYANRNETDKVRP
ncbi:MAG: thermonuclease family protein [Pseudomonadota bacterium]